MTIPDFLALNASHDLGFTSCLNVSKVHFLDKISDFGR